MSRMLEAPETEKIKTRFLDKIQPDDQIQELQAQVLELTEELDMLREKSCPREWTESFNSFGMVTGKGE